MRSVQIAIVVSLTSIIISLVAAFTINSYVHRNDPREPSKYELCVTHGGEYKSEGDNRSDDYSCTGVDVPSSP